MEEPSSSVRVPRIVDFRRFSAHSLWKGVGTTSVISSAVKPIILIGFIHDSKTGVVSLPSSWLRQFCHKKSSRESTTIVFSIVSSLNLLRRNPGPVSRGPSAGRAVLRAESLIPSGFPRFSYAQMHRLDAGRVDNFSHSIRKALPRKRLPDSPSRTGMAKAGLIPPVAAGGAAGGERRNRMRD